MDENPTSKSISDQKDIDRSYHFPTLFLVTKAAGWLLLSTLFSLVASIKMHSPTFLSNCPWVTYGVLVPAAQNAFLYGFALQAGFAAMLWMTMRLGQVKLRGPGFLFSGHGSVEYRLVGGNSRIDGRGAKRLRLFEHARFRLSHAFYGLRPHRRHDPFDFFKRQAREIYPSQWFIYASLYWFPWMLTAASYAPLLRSRLVESPRQ